VRATLRAMPEHIRAELRKAMTRITLKLARHSVQTKLSGQVLKRRTGTLARSVMQSPRVYETAEAVVGSVGIADITGPGGRAPVHYGAAHEFGGEITIPEHLRLVKQAFGRELKFPVWANVRSHTVKLPERSFLRSSLQDLYADGTIGAEVAAAVGDGVGRAAR